MNPELSLNLEANGERRVKERASKVATPIEQKRVTTSKSSRVKDGSVVQKVPNFNQKACPKELTKSKDEFDFVPTEEDEPKRVTRSSRKTPEKPETKVTERRTKNKNCMANEPTVGTKPLLPVAEEAEDASETNRNEAEAMQKTLDLKRRQSIEHYVVREKATKQSPVSKEIVNKKDLTSSKKFDGQKQKFQTRLEDAIMANSPGVRMKKVFSATGHSKLDIEHDDNWTNLADSDVLVNNYENLNVDAVDVDLRQITLTKTRHTETKLIQSSSNVSGTKDIQVSHTNYESMNVCQVAYANRSDAQTDAVKMTSTADELKESSEPDHGSRMEATGSEEPMVASADQNSQLSDQSEDVLGASLVTPIPSPNTDGSVQQVRGSFMSLPDRTSEDDALSTANLPKLFDDEIRKEAYIAEWRSDEGLHLSCENPDLWRVPDGREFVKAQNSSRSSEFRSVLRNYKVNWPDIYDNERIDLTINRGYDDDYPSLLMPHHPKCPSKRGLQDIQRVIFDADLAQYTMVSFLKMQKILNGISPKSSSLICFERFWNENRAKFGDAFRYICDLAAVCDEILPESLPYLVSPVRSVTMSLKQCTTILALGFLGVFRGRNYRAIAGKEFPKLSFDEIFANDTNVNQEKLKFIFNYFEWCRKNDHKDSPTRSLQITFFRRKLEKKYDWANSKTLLWSSLMALSKHKIETIFNSTHLDFANAFFGGGVLSHGSVQEEIRLLCAPDALVAMLLCPVMEPDEAIHIIGAPTISCYEGYGNSLRFLSERPDNRQEYEQKDAWERCNTEILAIDAINFSSRFYKSNAEQYSKKCIDRELHKAYVGFFNQDSPNRGRPLSTGKWGCGAFGGDPFLKALIQWMAAAVCDRDMVFCCIDDQQLQFTLDAFIVAFKKFNMTVGALYHLLINYEWKPPPNGIELAQYLVTQMEMAYDGDLLKA